jgi:hypothetical protein
MPEMGVEAHSVIAVFRSESWFKVRRRYHATALSVTSACQRRAEKVEVAAAVKSQWPGRQACEGLTKPRA